MTALRIGEGHDIHRLVPGRDLLLGGILIDSSLGALGHSDADVLLHAVCDALLGAAALGDIGRFFPDTDPRYSGADSRELLKETYRLVRREGYTLINLDATVFLQRPKLSPYMDAICARLSEDLCCARDAVSVKAKTGEKLGDIGEGRAVAASCTVLIERISP